ncbi:MAG: hypothetical protein R2701_03405 [Acidimicrobiales bacterium]
MHLLAFEPNPSVAACLERSLALHPDRSRIELRRELVSDVDEGTEVLRIDPSWSGSASASLGSEGTRSVEVPPNPRLHHRRRAEPAPTADEDRRRGVGGPHPRRRRRPARSGGNRGAGGEFGPITCGDPGATLPRSSRPLALGSCWTIDWEGVASPVSTPPPGPCDLLVIDDPDLAVRLALP